MTPDVHDFAIWWCDSDLCTPHAGAGPMVANAAPATPKPRLPHGNSAVAKLAVARRQGSKRLAGQPPETITPPKEKRQRAV